MSEKRYIFETVEITDDNGESRVVDVITDKEECYSYENLCDIAVLLNGKEATIQRLEKENQRVYGIIEDGGVLLTEKQFTLMLPNAIINDTIVRKSYYLSEKEDVEELVGVLNEQQEQLDLYKEAILTMLGLLADKGIIFSGVKDE